MVKDARFLTTEIDIKAIIEMKIDILPLVYINYSLSFEYIAQHIASPPL